MSFSKSSGLRVNRTADDEAVEESEYLIGSDPHGIHEEATNSWQSTASLIVCAMAGVGAVSFLFFDYYNL
jgi:hypothetical protein